MKNHLSTVSKVSRPSKKSLLWFLLTGIFCLCLPAMAGKGESKEPKKPALTPEQMSELWQSAWNSTFEQQKMSSIQEEMIWQAVELGSAETFASQKNAKILGVMLSGLQKRLPGKQFLEVLDQMRPMFSFIEQTGYNIPFCICSTAVPTAGCASPCAGYGQGVACLPVYIGPGTYLDGMCFTDIP